MSELEKKSKTKSKSKRLSNTTLIIIGSVVIASVLIVILMSIMENATERSSIEYVQVVNDS